MALRCCTALLSAILFAVVLACATGPAAVAGRPIAECATGGSAGLNVSSVQCLVAPCSTPDCKKKCGAFPSQWSVKCVDNYTKGCDCDCCTPKNALCSTASGAPPCCDGLVCELSNDCVVNPFTKCGTVCVPPSEAVSGCKKAKRYCNPSKKTPCCSGLTCVATSKTKGSCQSCRGLEMSCSSSRPCCPYLTCAKDKKTGKKSCKPMMP